MNYSNKRWITLISTIPISISIGSFYAWSVFSIPLSEELGVSVAAVTVAFTLSSGVGGIMNIAGGFAYDRYGPRLVLTVGGILFALGVILTGFSDSLLWLYLSFGLINGMGLGISYCTFLMNTADGFPDRRGMATGIIICGYGSGSFVFAPLGNYLIENYGVLNAFKIWGVIVLVVTVIMAQFIKKPPDNFRPDGWNPEDTSKSIIQITKDMNWRQMLKDPLYYLILGMMTITTTAGLMIMGHASAITQTLSGVNASTAAWIVGIVSVINAGGRFIWPTLSDKAGRSRTLAIIYLLSAAAIISLVFVQPGQIAFLSIIMFLIGFGYGGSMGIFPSITTDSFGTKNSGVNFGLVLLGSTFGSFIGPTLASVAQETTGSYFIAFTAASALCLVGFILALISGRLIKARQTYQ